MTTGDAAAAGAVIGTGQSEEGLSEREVALVWMADILGRLYESWPRKTLLDPLVTIQATGVSPPAGVDTVTLWLDLGEWLEKEGAIRLGDGWVGSSALHDAVLTSQGYALLGRPVPNAAGKTVGAKLGELAKEAGREAAKAGMKQAAQGVADTAGQFIGGLVKSFGS